MAKKYNKFYPDPAQEVTAEHKSLLVQWGLWADAERRGVKAAQDEAVGDSGDDSETPGPTDPDGVVTEASTGSGDDDTDYVDWTNADLKAELKDRGLTVGGTHDELVARLEADDEV
jgi:SAP domain